MTLSARNTVFKAGIALSLLCLLICIAASVKVIPVYSLMEQDITVRSKGIFHAIVEKFLSVKILAVHCCIAVSVLYSLLTLFFIYFSFEKTQSPEILFVAFFAVSFAPETLRLLLPLGHVYEISPLYLLMASRVILFGRCFGIFSLFAAGIYAVGFEVRRQRSVVLAIIVLTLIIALGVPVDTYTRDSGFNVISGYSSMFRLIEAGAFLITAVSFFIAAWLRSSREITLIGAGTVLVFLGRIILLTADSWAGPAAGTVFLVFGTWLICTNLHKMYLWL
jgi:hypothetical protein